MSALIDSLKQYPMPALATPADRLAALQFSYALTVAHRPLLEAAKLPELFSEEQGKAEWLRADIAAMGGTVPEFDYTAACLVGAQYYVLLHVHPKAVLGYFAALECCALPGLGRDWMEQAYGSPGYTCEEDDRFPLLPMIELIAVHNRWLGHHIINNAHNTAAGIANVLRARFGKTPATAEPKRPMSVPRMC